MEFLAEFILQFVFYVGGWAVGAAILYACSWGRIISTKNVHGIYEHLPSGKIAANPEIVCYFGALTGLLAVAVWLFLFH
jgi:hypothetical protein